MQEPEWRGARSGLQLLSDAQGPLTEGSTIARLLFRKTGKSLGMKNMLLQASKQKWLYLGLGLRIIHPMNARVFYWMLTSGLLVLRM